MRIHEIGHSSAAASREIRDLLFEAYSIEAALIGVSDFPPLRRSDDDIRRAGSMFLGGTIGGSLAAVVELEMEGNHTICIASFAVHPSRFRQGVGSRLLRHIVDLHAGARLTLSTAKLNTPALSLYEKHGFVVVDSWRMKCGIEMVTMVHQGNTREHQSLE